MAQKMRVTTVWVEYLDHDSGHWCNACMLGTGVRVWITLSHGARMHLQQRLQCSDCGGHDITLTDHEA